LIDNKPKRIPTGLKGPIILNGQPHGALLLGHSSSEFKGLFILPELIDADYNGEIRIVAQTSFQPLFIPAGSRIAQLVPLQQLTSDMTPASEQLRGAGSFGSTGQAALLALFLERRP
ncbi:POK9 protein, partial [Neodrepanis coruscans]|nr:POK9 protein [Neodrepanis coruscans]